MLSFISGAFNNAEATLLMAPIAIIYSGSSGLLSFDFFIISSTAGASTTFFSDPMYCFTPLKTNFS